MPEEQIDNIDRQQPEPQATREGFVDPSFRKPPAEANFDEEREVPGAPEPRRRKRRTITLGDDGNASFGDSEGNPEAPQVQAAVQPQVQQIPPDPFMEPQDAETIQTASPVPEGVSVTEGSQESAPVPRIDKGAEHRKSASAGGAPAKRGVAELPEDYNSVDEFVLGVLDETRADEYRQNLPKKDYSALDNFLAKAAGDVNSENFTHAVIRIVREACEITRDYARTDYEVRKIAHGIFETPVEGAVEDFLRDKLTRLLPGCGFISAKTPNDLGRNGYNWVINPLGGIVNYLHGMPYSVSVALLHGSTTVLGAVLACTTNVMFFGRKGQGAFKEYIDGVRIALQASPMSEIEGLMFFGLPTYKRNKGNLLFYRVAKLYPYASDMKRIGDTPLDITEISNGVGKLFIEFDLQAWDIAAALLILTECGGSYALTKDNMMMLGTKPAIAQAIKALDVELR